MLGSGNATFWPRATLVASKITKVNNRAARRKACRAKSAGQFMIDLLIVEPSVKRPTLGTKAAVLLQGPCLIVRITGNCQSNWGMGQRANCAKSFVTRRNGRRRKAPPGAIDTEGRRQSNRH